MLGNCSFCFWPWPLMLISHTSHTNHQRSFIGPRKLTPYSSPPKTLCKRRDFWSASTKSFISEVEKFKANNVAACGHHSCFMTLQAAKFDLFKMIFNHIYNVNVRAITLKMKMCSYIRIYIDLRRARYSNITAYLRDIILTWSWFKNKEIFLKGLQDMLFLFYFFLFPSLPIAEEQGQKLANTKFLETAWIRSPLLLKLVWYCRKLLGKQILNRSGSEIILSICAF